MKILVIYWQPAGNDRKTIDEHLRSFARYSSADCYYINAYVSVPFFLSKISFDLVVYHYTFVGQKFNGEAYFSKILKKHRSLKKIKGFKVALPQDEYVNTEVFGRFLKDFNIDKVYTCFYQQDWKQIYPEERTGVKQLETVLTGYVDERSLAECAAKIRPHRHRHYDIGYRARKVPYWLGEHGTIKWRITEAFQALQNDYPSLIMNLSNDEKDVFKGNSWHEFLLNCRVVLGCEGGASLHDPKGEIRIKVDEFLSSNPEADFEAVKEACFPFEDNGIELFAISPRHFDACITRTCQVLVEGKYHGIFKPNVHYIELKKDFSNVREVLEKLKDIDYCEKIAEQAYRDIIESGEFTYSKFVRKVLSDVPQVIASNSLAYDFLLTYYNISSRSGYVLQAMIYVIKRPIYLLLKYTGLLPRVKTFYLNYRLSRSS